ncbi:DUF6338 family protein, partial [Marinococcus luteus]|uniref:DUF6338 family protein n=1 Tax=Marinococcus luteus TaxID=1122204 RepID=UPI002ACCE14D
MPFDSYDSVLYSIIFLVPGYVMNTAFESIVVTRSYSWQNNILRFLIFSILNYALWSWFLYEAIEETVWANHPVYWFLSLIGVLVVSPYIVGFLFGIISKKEWIRNILALLNINPIHQVPTAWDYIMHRSSWII